MTKRGSSELPVAISSKHPNSGCCRCRLLYCGLTKFCYEEVEIDSPPGTVINIDHASVSATMRRGVREDYNRLQCSELFERSKCKEVSGWFQQVPHSSNNLYVWIFGSSVYRQCSSVVFDDVEKAFAKIEFVDESGDPICFNEEGKHCYFVPFLSDNVAMLTLYRFLEKKRSLSNDESQLLTLLNEYDQMSPAEQDSMFFTGKVFNTSGDTFREDIWSSRLVGCLESCS